METKNECSLLVGKSEGQKPSGRPKRRWEDDIMNLREVGCDPGDWTYLAEDRD